MEPDQWKQVGALYGALCINFPPCPGGMIQELEQIPLRGEDLTIWGWAFV